MNAPALFLAFALGKAAALLGHPVPHSWWAVPGYLWQDALVALAFALLELVAPKRLSAILFWVLTVYAAFNIPVMRAVATPLTLPMLHATGGPLADSFRLYATWSNAGLVIAVLLTAAIAMRLPKIAGRFALVVLLAVGALGPLASARVDSYGLGRNPVVALASGFRRT